MHWMAREKSVSRHDARFECDGRINGAITHTVKCIIVIMNFFPTKRVCVFVAKQTKWHALSNGLLKVDTSDQKQKKIAENIR